MQIFADYIQPLTAWLQAHPNWALTFTFLISFAESLAIIGSLIPGSVSMTAIGILAGSGILPIDLTMLFAILGAIAGDGLSYTIGFIYKDSLHLMYPFNRYPHWLDYGKDYFEKHGGKSVLIGRFVGPLRSIIPLIAGMLSMNKVRFLMANILSAIGWSWLYVTPGILIGAASTELSTEAATRFIILILFMLLGVWLLSLLMKWVLLHTHRFLRINLHHFWAWSIKHPLCAKAIRWLTPIDENDFYPTALFVILTLLFFILLCAMILTVHIDGGITVLDAPINLFLQSIRTKSFDLVFVFFTHFCYSGVVIGFLILVNALLLINAKKNLRVLLFWNCLTLSNFLLSLIILLRLNVPRPQGLMYIKSVAAFPSINLCIMTSFCLGIILYLQTRPTHLYNLFARLFFSALPLMVGFAMIYLGDHWFSDILGSYLLALFLTCLHWVFFRRRPIKKIGNEYYLYALIAALVMMMSFSFYSSKKNDILMHQPFIAQFNVLENEWWESKNPFLPLYRLNRIGQQVSLFNIQYLGSLRSLQTMLRVHGWKTYHETFLNAVVKRIGGFSSTAVPLLSPLYKNRKPSLVMTFKSEAENTIVLRLWRSNYHVKDKEQSIWLGSIQTQNTKHHQDKTLHPLLYLQLDTSLFQFKQYIIPKNKIRKLPIKMDYIILLIREHNYLNDNLALNYKTNS